MDHVLLGGDASARHLAADHEGPVFIQFSLGALGAHVTVVLLVAAVEFEQDIGVIWHMGQGCVSELLDEQATKAVGLQFDLFDGCFAHILWGAVKSAEIMAYIKAKASCEADYLE